MSTMEITTRIGCKNACSYCPQDAFVKAYKARSDIFEMSFDLFKKCLDKVPKHVRIDFSGMAEPWLNRQCTKMLLYAHKKGYSLAVYTTLVGMEKEDIEAIKDIPFRVFEVHLPDANNMTRIKVDSDYLDKLARVRECNIQALTFMTIGEVLPVLQEVIGNGINCNDVIDRAGNLTEFPGVAKQERLRGIIRCKSCDTRLDHNVLLANGDVILCCMDYGMHYVLGNLAEMTYEEILTSPVARQLRKSLLDDREDVLCRYCHNAKRSKLNWLPGARVFLKKRLG